MIPYRERGYSIEADTAVVHERYQDHAPRAMRTSALGVTNVANGREPVPCLVCFPAPPEPRKRGGRAVPAVLIPDVEAALIEDPYEAIKALPRVEPDAETA